MNRVTLEDVHEMAQRLNAAEAEVERLRAALTAERERADRAETDAAEAWRQVHLLKAGTSGPDGFATWKDAAIDERLRRVKAEAEVERLRAALMEILDECKNEGAYCPIVQERMLERIELCAMAAIDAARKETP